jgi:hypothetical protein
MRKLSALAALAAAPLLARAEEGMWTFNDFPRPAVESRYGMKVTDAWLDHVRLSSVRLAQGCSGSFVSPSGLVMTNHHCVETCLEQLSTPARNLVAEGFLARTTDEERKCPELEVNQLEAITDVTARMTKATAGLSGERFHAALRAETARIEKECQTDARLRCNVVPLYHGGRYDLYRYRRHQDVRLVFAPEYSIAFFGGDPDNFMFPRWDLDMAFLRVFEDGKPLAARDFLRWNPRGPQEGDLVFVSGNPGGTDRQLTVAELEYERDVAIPEIIARYSELRGGLTEYQRRGAEQKRVSTGMLYRMENSLKVYKGEREALVDPRFFQGKVDAERAFRKAAAADRRGGPEVEKAYASIQAATDLRRSLRKELAFVKDAQGFGSQYFELARMLLRGADERARPDEIRLEEYQESKLPALTQRLFSTAPIDDDFEAWKLAASLTRMREALGPDHPFVRKVLGTSSPEEKARALVAGTRLRDPALRRSLWEGGAAAVAASDDSFLALARLVDADSRALRATYEDRIASPVRQGSETIARARFALEGTASYPDATFTLRLSYGTVKGWKEGGREVAPFTTLAGAFERNTGRDPFALPASWLAAKPGLDLSTRFNLVTTNDIIGGNSGSPLVSRDGEAVGLVFDGNIWSLGGTYGFDEALNRTVAVDTAAMVEALSKIYGAERLLRELLAERAPVSLR